MNVIARRGITDYDEDFWNQFEEDIKSADPTVGQVFRYSSDFHTHYFNFSVETGDERPTLEFTLNGGYNFELVKMVEEKAKKIISKSLGIEPIIKTKNVVMGCTTILYCPINEMIIDDEQ